MGLIKDLAIELMNLYSMFIILIQKKEISLEIFYKNYMIEKIKINFQ